MYVVSSVVGGWGVVKVLGTAFLYANKERGEIQGHRKWSVSSSERGEGGEIARAQGGGIAAV